MGKVLKAKSGKSAAERAYFASGWVNPITSGSNSGQDMVNFLVRNDYELTLHKIDKETGERVGQPILLESGASIASFPNTKRAGDEFKTDPDYQLSIQVVEEDDGKDS